MRVERNQELNSTAKESCSAIDDAADGERARLLTADGGGDKQIQG